MPGPADVQSTEQSSLLPKSLRSRVNVQITRELPMLQRLLAVCSVKNSQAEKVDRARGGL